MQPVSVSNSNLFGTNYKLPALWAKEVGEFSNMWYQSQKTQGFVVQILRCYLTKEGRVQNLFYCLIWIKELCVRKFKGLAV